MRGHGGEHDGAARRPAFTLVELLIVLGVISLLVGGLVPALAAARQAARTARCAATLRQLHMGVGVWADDHRNALPGPNTTGLPYRGKVANILKLLGDTSPTTPTSTFDWISPVMGESMGLPANRAQRTWRIFHDLACPAARQVNTTLWPPAARSLADFEDFEQLFHERGFRQISYLAPATFLYRGPGYSRRRYEVYPFAGPMVIPDFYSPRIDRVGRVPAKKILVADGTRYLAAPGALDFDLSPKPEYYGSFTSATPIYEGSTAYGRAKAAAGFDAVRPGSRATYPLNRDLSYRHGGNMNAVFFDGHVDLLSEERSKTEAALWAPSGSLFTGKKATEEALARYEAGAKLP